MQEVPTWQPPGPDDEQLVVRARGGDVEAFTTLLMTHDRAMRGLVWSLVRDPWLMDDVLQLAYEKAYRRIGEFRAESSFRTWLHRICWTTAIDALRSDGRRRHESIDDHVELSQPGSGVETGTIGRITFEAAWQQLSGEHRSALMLVAGQGLSYEEAASALGTRAGTIASRVNRAKQRLAELLGDTTGPTAAQEGLA